MALEDRRLFLSPLTHPKQAIGLSHFLMARLKNSDVPSYLAAYPLHTHDIVTVAVSIVLCI